jgi:hypothetical protein
MLRVDLARSVPAGRSRHERCCVTNYAVAVAETTFRNSQIELTWKRTRRRSIEWSQRE